MNQSNKGKILGISKAVDADSRKVFIKRCHCCGHVMELTCEVDRCLQCKKSFLPLNYFAKIHRQQDNYQSLFSPGHELHEEDMIKGITVLW